MIDIKAVTYIILGLVSIGGAVVTFFQLQTRQSMKIEQLEKESDKIRDEIKEMKEAGHRRAEEIERLMTDHTHADTNTAIALLDQKLDTLLDAIQELKAERAHV